MMASSMNFYFDWTMSFGTLDLFDIDILLELLSKMQISLVCLSDAE